MSVCQSQPWTVLMVTRQLADMPTSEITWSLCKNDWTDRVAIRRVDWPHPVSFCVIRWVSHPKSAVRDVSWRRSLLVTKYFAALYLANGSSRRMVKREHYLEVVYEARALQKCSYRGHSKSCKRWRTDSVFVSRDDGIAAITAMITVHRAQQNLHHCQRSTSSRYYRLTRLHVRSIDSINRLDLSRLCRSTRLQRLSIDSVDRFQGLIAGEYNWQIGRANHSSGHTIVLWYCEWVTEIRYNLS